MDAIEGPERPLLEDDRASREHLVLEHDLLREDAPPEDEVPQRAGAADRQVADPVAIDVSEALDRDDIRGRPRVGADAGHPRRRLVHSEDLGKAPASPHDDHRPCVSHRLREHQLGDAVFRDVPEGRDVSQERPVCLLDTSPPAPEACRSTSGRLCVYSKPPGSVRVIPSIVTETSTLPGATATGVRATISDADRTAGARGGPIPEENPRRPAEPGSPQHDLHLPPPARRAARSRRG